jgi:hypothetical protein
VIITWCPLTELDVTEPVSWAAFATIENEVFEFGQDIYNVLGILFGNIGVEDNMHACIRDHRVQAVSIRSVEMRTSMNERSGHTQFVRGRAFDLYN